MKTTKIIVHLSGGLVYQVHMLGDSSQQQIEYVVIDVDSNAEEGVVISPPQDGEVNEGDKFHRYVNLCNDTPDHINQQINDELTELDY